MVYAPLSENLGRRPIYATTLLVALVFLIPCAVAKNIGMTRKPFVSYLSMLTRFS